MTNAERRAALNMARKRCLEHAMASDKPSLDGTADLRTWHREQARMWAAVAESMKDGDPAHDAPDGAPVGYHVEQGTITRTIGIP